MAATAQELYTSLPHGWQGLRYLGHLMVPSLAGSWTRGRAAGTQTSIPIQDASDASGDLTCFITVLAPILVFICQMFEGFQNRNFPLLVRVRKGHSGIPPGGTMTWLDLSGEQGGNKHCLPESVNVLSHLNSAIHILNY